MAQLDQNEICDSSLFHNIGKTYCEGSRAPVALYILAGIARSAHIPLVPAEGLSEPLTHLYPQTWGGPSALLPPPNTPLAHLLLKTPTLEQHLIWNADCC